MSAFRAMSREEVIANYLSLVKEFDIPDGDIWLGGGSAMIMYGLRLSTMDLDAGVHEKEFYRLAKASKSVVQIYDEADGYLHDDTRLFPLPLYNTDIHLEPETKVSDINEIDGVWCYTPKALMAQKQLLAKKLKRDKDFRDIEALKVYMSKNK